jgi:hypothetical protein
METGSNHRESRDRCALAPIWIRVLLAGHLQSPKDGRQEKDFQASARSHLPDGDGEPDVGRTAYSR